MKKIGVLFVFILMISLFNFSAVFAAGCDLQVSFVNQDPYPAIQGEEVKLLFQIDGLENPECKTTEFGLVEEYPITFMPDQQEIYFIKAGIFQKDYKSFFLAPFNVKVDEDAMDGDNQITVRYKQGTNVGYETKDFNLNVKDTRAKFEVHVKNYDFSTKIITFEILNIAKSNIEALTVEIPKQDNIVIKGTNNNIVGDLDSNEYTTADFEAVPVDGNIKLILHYSDEANIRRISEVEVSYESNYFEGLVKDEKKNPTTTYIVIAGVILLIIYLIIRNNKKKKELRKKLELKAKK